MAFQFRTLTTLLALWVVVTVDATAQAVAKRDVSLQFAVFAPRVLTDLEYLPKRGDVRASLEFFSAHRSNPYSYVGAPKLTFFHRGDRSAVAATFDIPEGMQRALLLFIPRESTGGAAGFEILPVDDSPARIAPGHFVFLNLTGRAMKAKYGSDTFDVPTGVSPAYPGSRAKYLRLSATLASKPVVLGGVQFGLETQQRAIVVLFPPEEKTALQPLIRVLHEDLPEPAGKK